MTDLDTPPVRARWGLLALLGLAMFASVTSELLPPAVILGMTASLDVSEARIGLLVTVWAGTIVIATGPLVRLTARAPQRALLVVALAVFAASDVLVGAAPSYGVVVVGRVLGAAAAAVSWAVVFGYAPTFAPPERLSRAMALVLGGGTLASVLGVPIGAALAGAGGWRLAFWAAGAVLAVLAVVLGLALPARPGSRGEGGGLRRDASLVPVVALLASGALLLTGYMALNAYVVPVLVRAGALPVAAVPVVLLAAGLAGAAALAVGGAVGDRFPRGVLLLLAGVVPVGALLLAVAGGSAWVAVPGAVLIGAGIGGLPPVFQAQVVRTASPALRGLAAAMFVVVLNVGIALGALVGGLVLDGAGLGAVPPVAAAVTAAAVLALAGLLVTRR